MKRARRERSKRCSIYDVARHAGVSVATVSRFTVGFPGISRPTRAKIKASIEELGFRPNPLARSLASRYKKSIGLIVSAGTRAYSDLFLAEILQGVAAGAAHLGWTVHLTMLNGAIEPRFILERHADLVDGSLILDVALELPDVAALAASPHRCVLINHRHKSLPFVAIDNFLGGKIAARHLVSLGHTRIACIGGNRESGSDRIAGYKEGLKSSGLRPVAVLDCEFDQKLARRAAHKLLSSPHPPTALLVASDWMACGVLAEASTMGLEVPRDVSVLSFDDAIIAETTWPPLSTIRQPLSEMGRIAFDMFHESLDAESRKRAPVRKLLQPELVERKTTAPPTKDL
ncbi:MAG: LacI family DNA-binding transcriptional regulator [Candidatus Hydrogenedentota bacterium]